MLQLLIMAVIKDRQLRTRLLFKTSMLMEGITAGEGDAHMAINMIIDINRASKSNFMRNTCFRYVPDDNVQHGMYGDLSVMKIEHSEWTLKYLYELIAVAMRKDFDQFNGVIRTFNPCITDDMVGETYHWLQSQLCTG